MFMTPNRGLVTENGDDTVHWHYTDMSLALY